MSDTFVVEAELRSDEGKGASRRLRRLEAKVPAIIYGGDSAPVSLSLIRKDLEKHLEKEAFYSAIIEVAYDGKKEKAILKALQRHPAKDFPMHADFFRVEANKAIKVSIPLHFTNEDTCVGVKMGGGRIQHTVNEVEVLALPADLPEFIEVDMTDVQVGDIIHLSDLQLPEGVTSTALALGDDRDMGVASVLAPRGGKGAGAGDEDAGDESADDATSEDAGDES
ncbi:MAG: 50S ribosomal protein L25/general stress protein Ctc [Gammaproteobacteria bacterium]|nr:50S ribosomal protein L25/general stress protein Ctc [Luminiphilus sp.]NCG06313.1 50S ribosomal protein L25/general stress protein Ctc [Gammaproteobacteria bacterium]